MTVRYKSATVDEFVEQHSHDVSRSGVFIKTNAPFPPGTLVKFELRVATDTPVISGVGRVVWKREPAQSYGTERPAGMGVKFIKIDEASRGVIERAVAKTAESGGAPRSFARAGESVPPTSRTTTASQPAPAPRRSTVMGLGGGSPGSYSSIPPASTTSSPPSRDTASSPLSVRVPASSMRAAAAAVDQPASTTFPKTSRSMAPVAEPTVMKQAAELLAEALKGAGGSMDEIGASPLLDVAGGRMEGIDAARGQSETGVPGAPPVPAGALPLPPPPRVPSGPEVAPVAALPAPPASPAPAAQGRTVSAKVAVPIVLVVVAACAAAAYFVLREPPTTRSRRTPFVSVPTASPTTAAAAPSVVATATAAASVAGSASAVPMGSAAATPSASAAAPAASGATTATPPATAATHAPAKTAAPPAAPPATDATPKTKPKPKPAADDNPY